MKLHSDERLNVVQNRDQAQGLIEKARKELEALGGN
jgi:hypothetical protein